MKKDCRQTQVCLWAGVVAKECALQRSTCYVQTTLDGWVGVRRCVKWAAWCACSIRTAHRDKNVVQPVWVHSVVYRRNKSPTSRRYLVNVSFDINAYILGNSNHWRHRQSRSIGWWSKRWFCHDHYTRSNVDTIERAQHNIRYGGHGSASGYSE
jgi:ribosomal protein L14